LIDSNELKTRLQPARIIHRKTEATKYLYGYFPTSINVHISFKDALFYGAVLNKENGMSRNISKRVSLECFSYIKNKLCEIHQFPIHYTHKEYHGTLWWSTSCIGATCNSVVCVCLCECVASLSLKQTLALTRPTVWGCGVEQRSMQLLVGKINSDITLLNTYAIVGLANLNGCIVLCVGNFADEKF
jgi:hypothetical protein